jgi:hypothetical protein
MSPDLLQTRQQAFIRSGLKQPHPQITENVASEIHETNRSPDPYIFIIDNGKLLPPNREPFEIERDSYLGWLEAIAFESIENWANQNETGMVFWFSPPFPGKYPNAKVVASEILHSSEGEKVLMNRAIVLDIDTKTLLQATNRFTGKLGLKKFRNPEDLRANPIFTSQNEMAALMEEITPYTEQTKLIGSGRDLVLKTETYSKLTIINSSQQLVYSQVHSIAESEGLMGQHKGSCPTAGKTAFERFSEGNSNGKWEYHSGVCRVCGNSTDVGPCSICKTCEKRF